MDYFYLGNDLLKIIILIFIYNTYKLLQTLSEHLNTLNSYVTSNDTIVSGIISGFGSLLGGVVGAGVAAFVAFKVAKQQIEADKKIEITHTKMKNRNYLISLINELKHNHLIYQLLIIKDNSDKLHCLETVVWDNIRFEASGFISIKQYDILVETYREIKDLKNNKIIEYKEDVDFELRYKILEKLINELNAYLINLQNNLN